MADLDDLEFVGLSDADNLDEITVPGELDGPSCETCGLALHYGGRGRKPRFCDDHKPNKPKAGTSVKRRRRSKRGNPGLEATGALAWGTAGMGLQMSGQSEGLIAAGRVMQIQAPDAGRRIARILDPYMTKFRFLQYLAGGTGQMGDLAGLVMPPLLVGIMAGNEAAQQVAEPILRAVLAPLAASILEAQEEQAKLMEQMTGSTEAGMQAQQAAGEILDIVFGRVDPNAS